MATDHPPPYYPKSVSRSRLRANPDEVRSRVTSILNASLSAGESTNPRIANLMPPPNPGVVSPVTTSRTRQKLVEIEKERDLLRQAVEKERAIAERLKLEGRTVVLSPAEKDSRAQSLKRDIRMASRETLRPSPVGMYKNVCSTDLLFLIDATGSMENQIDAAKAQCRSIADSVSSAFLNKAEVRMAVVGYRDHTHSPNIEFLDFTPSIDCVHSFLTDLKALRAYEADIPEDVLGGLRRALNATWVHQTRCIVHVADAPPHGSILQNYPMDDDLYPVAGSEPHGLTHEPLLAQMIKMNINYALLRINSSTDRMASIFCKAYIEAGGDGTLLARNKYYNSSLTSPGDIPGYGSGYSRPRSTGTGLIFEEAKLGTTYDFLHQLVVRMVTKSAGRTAMRASMAIRRGGTRQPTTLGAIREDGNNDVPLEDVPPQWNSPGWLNETLKVEGFLPDMGIHSASTLNDMMASDDNIKMSFAQLTIHKRSRPFAQGAMRTASYARTTASTSRFVVKAFKSRGKRLAHVAEDMYGQALCKAFALEFNALTGESSSPIDFIISTCLKGDRGRPGSTASDENCMSLEPYIPGDYIKYNDNCGWVNNYANNRFSELAQAFTHFTFERSRGTLMVSDLQGVGHILTDPCIHTEDEERFKLSDTNLNSEGFIFFFATHTCNSICGRLGLKSNAQMFMTDRWEFRESWPELDNTVCCSNKLCGKIVHLNGVRQSEQFPGYRWCLTCWPQLQSSEVTRICVATSNHHEFRVSTFFHESQGQSVPRTCDEHRESSEVGLDIEAGALVRDEVTTRRRFWDRLKFARKEH